MQSHFKEKFESLRQGHHACLFYDRAEVSREITIEFINMGLQKNERCIYRADTLAVNAVIAGLAAAGVDVKSETARGALDLTPARDYLVEGRFDGGHIIKFLSEGIDHALKKGFAGLRATGDIVWEFGSDENMEQLEEYESKLDKFCAGKKITVLCQYDCNAVPANHLRHALGCHNAIVYEEVVFLNNTFHTSNPQ
jgi:hypothetical protein